MHSTNAYVAIMTSHCVQGGEGVKRPSCVRTKYVAHYKIRKNGSPVSSGLTDHISPCLLHFWHNKVALFFSKVLSFRENKIR